MSSNSHKLRVLRARTDHDLLILLQRELDRALVLVDAANTRICPLSFTRAAKALNTARVLVGTISNLSHIDGLRIEETLNALGFRLDQVTVDGKMRPVASAGFTA